MLGVAMLVNKQDQKRSITKYEAGITVVVRARKILINPRNDSLVSVLLWFRCSQSEDLPS